MGAECQSCDTFPERRLRAGTSGWKPLRPMTRQRHSLSGPKSAAAWGRGRRGDRVRRREFILLGGAAAAAAASWPRPLRAQQPTIGFLRGSTADGSTSIVAAFHRGLNETGYVEGQNVALDYRWSDNRADQLPGLAADLVRRRVAVIVASGGAAALAAKAATSTIPIVFVTPLDPVAYGLVATLNRPGGNATGMSYLTSVLAGKRLEFLRQLVPAATSIAVLVSPGTPVTEALLKDLQAGAGTLGLHIHVATVTS